MNNHRLKLIWRVASVPTGRYRSFMLRGWPTAHYPTGEPAVALYCQDEYRPAEVKAGLHGPIRICIADHSVSPWDWRSLKQPAATLKEAKERAAAFLDAHPNLRPAAGFALRMVHDERAAE